MRNKVFVPLLATALAASILFCAWVDLSSQRKLRETRAHVASARAELEPLRAISGEVALYNKQKDALQERIDVINRQKQAQKRAADAVAKLSGVDGSDVESVAVVDDDLVVNRR